MSEKRDDVIAVTVSAPAGKRALVTIEEDEGCGVTRLTVVGGTSQHIYVSRDRSVYVEEGEPHHTVAPGTDTA